jgi:hypothetical protein
MTSLIPGFEYDVFISIISRTYCDPKSFKWEHEFKAFVEQTSMDRYGLKIKLPNCNVASRVLPVINYLKILTRRYLMTYLLLNLLLTHGFSEFAVSPQNDTIKKKEHKPVKAKQDISLFGSDDILNVSIYLDLAAFLKKTSKTDSFEGQMIINPDKPDSINRNVRINYRGILRYDLCSFPPMQINFSKPLYSDSIKIKKLKLVTHCEPATITDEYVIREYLVYKLFNALTDTSLKVRLLKINYIDSKRNKKAIVKYGFFIEPLQFLAKRTNSSIIELKTLNQNHIMPKVIDRLAIFNYLVSNWDWSVPGQHNVEILKPLSYDAGPLGLAVPYDFDLTGIVNAEYAVPPPEIGIQTIRERLFSGLCRTKEVYTGDLREFTDKKEKLYAVINDCPYLNQRSKKDITNYMDEFYDQLEKPKSLNNLLEDFLKTCKY